MALHLQEEAVFLGTFVQLAASTEMARQWGGMQMSAQPGRSVPQDRKTPYCVPLVNSARRKVSKIFRDARHAHVAHIVTQPG